MSRNVIVVLSAMMVLTLCVQGCVVPTNQPPTSSPASNPAPALSETQSAPSRSLPSPPKIPQEVLMIWNLQPTLESSPADLTGELSLKPNPDIAEPEVTNAGNISYYVAHTPWQDTPHFQLKPNQWVDVIISSLDVPVYCLGEQPGAISFQLQRIHQEPGKECRQTIGGMAVKPVGGTEDEQFNSLTFAVLSGKRLYENRVVGTQEGTFFTSAYRLFVGVGSEEFADADYVIHFSNFNHQRGAEITYRLYKLGTTSNWGETYAAEQLQPWFNELYELSISGKLSDDEYREAESEWLRQLAD
jgi:hypothetical protein